MRSRFKGGKLRGALLTEVRGKARNSLSPFLCCVTVNTSIKEAKTIEFPFHHEWMTVSFKISVAQCAGPAPNTAVVVRLEILLLGTYLFHYLLAKKEVLLVQALVLPCAAEAQTFQQQLRRSCPRSEDGGRCRNSRRIYRL